METKKLDSPSSSSDNKSRKTRKKVTPAISPAAKPKSMLEILRVHRKNNQFKDKQNKVLKSLFDQKQIFCKYDSDDLSVYSSDEEPNQSWQFLKK